MTPLVDIHNHLQDPLLQTAFPGLLDEMTQAGIGTSVVNGTCEEDWPAVTALAQAHPNNIIPSYGLHPWKVDGRSADWLEHLTGLVEQTPGAGVGECGLDRWIESHDLDLQREIFLPQIALAARLNRPLTIHCLRAWGAMLDCLRQSDLPERGFLLHAYGGPTEMVPDFTALGAYFSFSGSFLDPRRQRKAETFQSIPRDRLLIETDAPSMPLPSSLTRFRLSTGDQDAANHPANLVVTFEGLADHLGLPLTDLRETLATNESRFLGT